MEIRLKINRKNGLHIRMGAAFISFLQSLIPDKEKLQRTYVIYNGKKVQANNLLSLVALKIKQGDEFTLVLDENTDQKTVEQIQAFFNQAASEDTRQTETDRLLMENSVTLHEAVSSIPNGIIVVNKENVIIYVNRAAAELLEKEPQDILNRRADEVIPHSCLHKILQTGKTEITEKQQINHYTVITTRSPILLNDQIIGAVAIFQDISSIEKISKELNEVKELQEKLNLVLQSVTDLIGLTDEKGDFIFSNEGMDKLLKKREGKRNIREIIGKTGWEDLIRRRNPFMKVTKHKGQSFITKVNPVIVEKEIRGTVATMTPLDDVKQLLEKIDIMEQRTRYLEQELSKHKGLSSAFHKIIGNSETLKDALTIADKVAKTHSTVLITGESGTGKELVARAIHEASPRKNHPFIRVNCAAIPPQLMESELFGYEKGAFTGAYKTHRGKFELADKGTIFLDEIGDLNLELQGKLLRVLQEKEIVRIGGFSTIHLDVRVIAATNRDLAKMVEEGTFREDLYYRLNVVPIHLPPLRARKEDIPLLVEAFRVELNARLGKNIKGYEKGFIEALCNYHWPGNIRELQNIMERLFNLADGDYLLCKDLPHYISNPHATDSSKGQEETIVLSKDKPLHEYEKQIFAYACQFYPSFNQLAKSLGITHKTAASKIRKYKLEHLVGKKYQGD
ncbi:sigma 54-interacting transcriptional regulator [Caldibacillus debilis]|jgi:TyrR family helix-turn-helix protein/PAS domain S-box-containing protein|uniref:HTH-type transcriptional regulatory protein TyrR n=1 Tax=Caldibacillus debilis GB1 TaxID=1339248 RepID=A0A420VH17_9BACI|nr:sigma 54-interacting transcriptional regulator [Caldibacillus debilis]RKO62982.1 Transcriptional regulator containing PAS, AAA-type ATPase, and DNA-binding domain [Caldibacillus debilis GB1]